MQGLGIVDVIAA